MADMKFSQSNMNVRPIRPEYIEENHKTHNNTDNQNNNTKDGDQNSCRLVTLVGVNGVINHRR